MEDLYRSVITRIREEWISVDTRVEGTTSDRFLVVAEGLEGSGTDLEIHP